LSFPPTHLSLVRRVRSRDAETRTRAEDALAAAYWAPIHAYIRQTHGRDGADAEDLTQGFFAEALRRDLFARYDPIRARFRTFVRRCVDSYVLNALQAERRQKRGGGFSFVSLDAAEIEAGLTSDGDSCTEADATFHREWVRSVLATALAQLRDRYRAAGRLVHLALFERYDIDDSDAPPAYAELAAEHGIPVTQVTNWLAATRRDFRSIVLETIRDLSGDEEGFREEVRALLGIEVP
jgi:RNA polymerase sigma factor (sigma-70 family)